MKLDVSGIPRESSKRARFRGLETRKDLGLGLELEQWLGLEPGPVLVLTATALGRSRKNK